MGESFAVRFTALDTGKNSSSASGAGWIAAIALCASTFGSSQKSNASGGTIDRHAVMDMRDGAATPWW